MEPYVWNCYACGKEACKQCRSVYRAGIGETDARPLCRQCCEAAPFPFQQVGSVVRDYLDEAQELREKYQRAIDDIWSKYKETIACRATETRT
jgi:hypothetical protein